VAPSSAWRLDASIAFLNHGSFGACPTPVLTEQAAWRERLEAEPVAFLGRDLPDLLAAAGAELGAFLGADPDDLAFVTNATAGVNTVLASLRLRPSDQLLTTDHEYNAVLNAMAVTAERARARVVIAPVPFPIRDPGEVTDAVLRAVTPRTRLAVLSHVTSPTAVIFPIAELVTELARRGVDTLADGAHAPGMVPLALDTLGAAYYTGNAHKWLCAPKGAAFLHVRRDRQAFVRPLVISHGANEAPPGATRFRREFDWTGTADPSAFLSVPAAIRFMGSLLPGGWPAVMAANRELILSARDRLCAALGVYPPIPDAMLGSMAAVPLPAPTGADETWATDLNRALLEDERIEVPIGGWPVRAARTSGAPPTAFLLRVSAQVYNRPEEYERLARALEGRVGFGPTT
jgi:isopenicillin-N epimerase